MEDYIGAFSDDGWISTRRICTYTLPREKTLTQKLIAECEKTYLGMTLNMLRSIGRSTH